jgi:hypothetical protein
MSSSVVVVVVGMVVVEVVIVAEENLNTIDERERLNATVKKKVKGKQSDARPISYFYKLRTPFAPSSPQRQFRSPPVPSSFISPSNSNSKHQTRMKQQQTTNTNKIRANNKQE